jgi:hypothetical protein
MSRLFGTERVSKTPSTLGRRHLNPFSSCAINGIQPNCGSHLFFLRLSLVNSRHENPHRGFPCIAKRFNLQDAPPKKTPMDANFKLTEEDLMETATEEMISLYRSMIGSIGYACVALRYDCLYAFSVLSKYLARGCWEMSMQSYIERINSTTRSLVSV